MNDLERAVIERAQALIDLHESMSIPYNSTQGMLLRDAVNALNEHDQALTAAGLKEVDWAQVVEGDELRGKSGEFYPVTATKREWQMGKPTGNFLITVRVSGKNRMLSRATTTHGKATVRRGAAGAAVDVIVSVFESGEI